MSILFINSSSKRNMALAILLGCSTLGYPFSGHAETLSAKTSWAVSRVASSSQGSYCTMAQKYSDDTVLTFAQNMNAEYSLAFDFKNGQFKEGDKQNVTLRPQGGSEQKYSVKPKSDRTMVVNIGKDVSFINQIAKSGKMSVDVGNKEIDFALDEFKAGQGEMDGCLNGLKSASGNVKKLAPEDLVKRQVAVVRTPEITDTQPTAEGLLAAAPMPSADIIPAVIQEKEDQFINVAEAPAPAEPIPLAAAPAPASPVVVAQNNQDILALKEENARLTRAIAEQRQSFENMKSERETAALGELREKLDTVRSENESLKRELAAVTPKEDSSKLKSDVASIGQSMKLLQDENQTLKLQLAEQKSLANKAEASSSQALKANQELESMKHELASANGKEDPSKLKTNILTLSQSVKLLQDENQSLKVQLADQKALIGKAESLNGETQKVSQELTALRVENETLKNQLKIAAPTKAEPVVMDDKELSRLQLENKELRQVVADFKSASNEIANNQPASVSDDEVMKLRKDIQQATGQLDVLIAENNALKTQIASLQKDMEGKQLKSAGGNWDLEQSTRRYQESQREIVRLGALIQSQDAKCTSEKKDIESMLFDPEIADKAQIAMVNSLQDQIKEKDEKIKSLESQAPSVDLKANSEKDKEIADLKQTIAQAQNELAQKNQQLADMKVGAKQASETAQAESEKDKQIAVLKQNIFQAQNELVQKNQQLANMKVAIKQPSEPNVDPELVDQVAAIVDKKPLPVRPQEFTPIKNVANQVAEVTPAAATYEEDTSAAPEQLTPIAFKSMDEMSSLLRNAGIKIVGSLQKVQGGDPSSYRAYSWKTDSLYGSVEMKQVADEAQLGSVVDQYLARAKARCQGDFAAVPSADTAGMNNSQAYEIACVGKDSSSSASVLFSYGNQMATTIAHEGRAEAMDLAIDARDRIASQFN